MNGQTKFVIDKIQQHNIKRVLNIGFRDGSDLTVRNFIKSLGGEFHVLEVWKPNCDVLTKNGVVDKVICEDVRNINNSIKENEYDAVFWLHGPEHITWDDFLNCKERIDSIATKLVIYQAPIGEHPQDELYGNPFEKHVTSLEPEMFLSLGYDIILHNGSGVGSYAFVPTECTFSAILKK